MFQKSDPGKWARMSAASAIAMGLAALPAAAAVEYDQDVTPDIIFGSGVGNGGFTTDRANGVEIGLRGKLRFNENNLPEDTFNSNGDGTYTFPAILPPTGYSWIPGAPTTPVWNWEWSINTNYDGSTAWNLDDLTYQLQIDFDPAPDTDLDTSSMVRSYDLINDPDPAKNDQPWYDHGIGDNSTPNGGGAEASDESTYQDLIANNNVAQNSWSHEFVNEDEWDIFDPTVPGEYTVSIAAFDGGDEIARSTIHIITGTQLVVSAGEDWCADVDVNDQVSVDIDLQNADSPVAGGQFLIAYDADALQFNSASAGDEPFDNIFFTLADPLGTNDGTGTDHVFVAIGGPTPSGSTDADTRMATLHFTVTSEFCAEAGLVALDPGMQPLGTYLTNDLGLVVPHNAVNLDAQTVDDTPPALTVGSDITANSDAGLCSAEVPILPEDWETDVNAAVVPTGDPANPYAAELRSVDGDPEGQWGPTGALIWTPSSAMSFDDITHLAADYNLLTGCIVGGSPRFAIGIDSDNDGEANGHIFAHWGPEGSPWNHCPGPGWNSTGDLLASADARWEGAQLGGDTTMTYSEVQSLIDSLAFSDVVYVIISLDGYWNHDQVSLVDNVQIGSTVVDFGNPVAIDFCDTAPTVVGVRDDGDALTDSYPEGTTTITWTATDACGNETTATQDVIVTGDSELIADLAYDGFLDGSVERCITFDFSGTDSASVEQVVTFAGDGTASGVSVLVPCGDYDCVTIRDPLHTLATSVPLTINGPVYEADAASAGDAMVGGNFNGDDFVDILDFGVFVGQFGSGHAVNTDCATAAPHADITGNGTVNGGDFTFIQSNFLEISDIGCTISAPTSLVQTNGFDRPVQRISVRELHRRGLRDLVVADLNRDGWLDEQDIAAYLNGVQP